MEKRSFQDKSYFSPSEAAEIMMVSPATVRAWASKGELNAVATPGGHRRFHLQDLEDFAEARNLTLNLPDYGCVRVLIVDDDVQVATYLSRLLGRVDTDVENMIARNGFEAGRLVHTFKPNIVLLDLMMPEMNGFEVCRQIKEQAATRSTRVIAMTGFYNDENVRRVLECGAESCVQKPFDRDNLLQLLGFESSETAIGSGVAVAQ